MTTTARPGPLTCGHCQTVTDAWVFTPADVARDLSNGESPELAGWNLDDEWWVDPARFWDRDSYCCSQRCYLSRLSAKKIEA